MFYTTESLKKGGKFYMCWVADSWPSHFSKISHKYLRSQNIPRICDNLRQVVASESGHSTKRFSLRLSSKLLRGLVLLYDKKLNVLLEDLCKVNASVMSKVNKKYAIEDTFNERIQRPLPQIVITEEPEDEARVEEMLQNGGNTVANIENITLKEPTLPENLLPINDGFGELHIDSVERTVEMMMLGEASVAQHSAAELMTDLSTDKLHDKSRLAPHDTVQMERVSEYEMSLYRKSVGMEFSEDFQKGKDIPEIPETTIPAPPDMHAPLPTAPSIVISEYMKPSDLQEPNKNGTVTEKETELEEFVLEDLVEEQQVKRRRFKKLIIDKKTKLSSDYLRVRTANSNVELRCKISHEDVIHIGVPAKMYFNRPAHAGPKIRSNLPPAITQLFMRNLGILDKPKLMDREMEEVVSRPSRASHLRSNLERIDEEEESHELRVQTKVHIDPNQSKNINISELNQGRQEEMDLSDLPTQVVETLSQPSRRTGEYQPHEKRRRTTFGYISLSCRQAEKTTEGTSGNEVEKENIPDIQQISARNGEGNLGVILREAGLADISRLIQKPIMIVPPQEQRRKSPRRQDSSSTSETPLGSLDRTKVSLGDSDTTTDSMKFVLDNWGTEGTMYKIHNFIEDGVQPLNVETLVSKGPIIAGRKRIIAARCFASILKLKKHGFLKIRKDPVTLAILDIGYGPKLQELIID